PRPWPTAGGTWPAGPGHSLSARRRSSRWWPLPLSRWKAGWCTCCGGWPPAKWTIWNSCSAKSRSCRPRWPPFWRCWNWSGQAGRRREKMENTEGMAVLEAVLFAHGDPVGTDKLAAALEWPEALVQEGLEALQARCMQPDSGLTLLRLGDHWQLATKNEYGA